MVGLGATNTLDFLQNVMKFLKHAKQIYGQYLYVLIGSTQYLYVLIGCTPHPVTVESEGLVRDLLRM